MTTTKQGRPSAKAQPAAKADKKNNLQDHPAQPAQGRRRTTGFAGADEDPEKKISIDDNPEETKRKIPHMKG